MYQWYLNSFPDETLDGITLLVSQQVDWLLQFFSSDVVVRIVSEAALVSFQSITSVRIIEGCNAVSVFILFVAFVFAFSGNLKKTLLFCGFGTLFLYVLNIIRIVVLILLLHHFPAYNYFLHDVLFPLIIYGSVFLLWFVWISKYSKYADQ